MAKTFTLAGRSIPRGGLVVTILALGVWLWLTLPLALGQETLYFRDVFSTHLPFKAFGARQLAEGHIPATNPSWALGQAFRGNPNALPFYPGNVLYLLLPFWSAFNLHYALHWLLAALSMALLARRLGQRPEAAVFAGLTYAGSGWVMSALSFYNILTVSAWWPLAMAGTLSVQGEGRRGARAVALGGVACGLALLGGEPVTAGLGLLAMIWIATTREGWRRGLARSCAVLGVGVLIALPQLVATLRVLPFSVRGQGLGTVLGQSGLYGFHPLRLLELVLAFPFGRPGDFGTTGYWAEAAVARVPYILTTHVGVVAVLLALFALRRHWRWGLLACGGLAAAILAGLGGDHLARLSGGLLRYPEKFLFWFALGAPLVAGWGLTRVLEAPGRFARVALAGAAGAAALVVGLRFAFGGWVVRFIDARLPTDSLPRTAAAQVALLLVALLFTAVVLGLAGWAARRRAGWALVAVQLLALFQLSPAWMTDRVEAYREPGVLAVSLEPGARVVFPSAVTAFGRTAPRFRGADTSFAARRRLEVTALDHSVGVLHGFEYPLAPDLEGLHTHLFGRILAALYGQESSGLVHWMRAVGVEAAVVMGEGGGAGLAPIAQTELASVPVRLVRVRPRQAPFAWRPEELVVVDSPAEAFRVVAASEDPDSRVAVLEPHDLLGPGTTRVMIAEPDHLKIEVDGAAGVAVFRRAYSPLWRARSGELPLEVFPAQVGLLAVAFPAGRQEIEITIGAGPEITAGVVALMTLFGALWVGFRRRPALGGSLG